MWVTVISSWRRKLPPQHWLELLFTLERSKETYLPLSKHQGHSSAPITFPAGGLRPRLQKGFNPILAT